MRFLLILFFFLFSLSSFAQGTWVQKASVFPIGRAGAVGFSIGTKGYFGTGWRFGLSVFYNDLWEWDKASNTWTQKADFPGTKRGDAAGFSIGAKGYIAGGIDSAMNYKNDLWEWNQSTNTWAAKANFPGTSRAFAASFSIGTKGYLGAGADGLAPLQDFWEWDQASNTWAQKANFTGGVRTAPVAFSIGNYGYLGTGGNMSTICNDFWEWSQASNTWTQKANLPGPARIYAAGFSIGTSGYLGTGGDVNGYPLDDFYEWNQSSNTWTQKANYSHPVNDIDHATFSIGCRGYFGAGVDESGSTSLFFNDFWEYTPDNLPAVPAVVTASSTICIGDTVLLNAGGGTYYSWNTGSTNNSITVIPGATTTYSVTVSTDCNSKTVASTIYVVQSGTASFSFEYDPCESGCVKFSNASVNAFSWCWTMGDGGSSSAQNPCWPYSANGTYNPSLIINCNTGCADTMSMPVPYEAHDTASVLYIPNAFSPNEDNENDKLKFYMKDTYCMKEFSIVIYNRWGEKVFETADITSEWDGTFNGQKPDSDVFTYYCKMVSVTGTVTNRKGNISLVR